MTWQRRFNVNHPTDCAAAHPGSTLDLVEVAPVGMERGRWFLRGTSCRPSRIKADAAMMNYPQLVGFFEIGAKLCFEFI